MDARLPHAAQCAPHEPEGPISAASLSLILPAYNEEDSIRQAVTEADAALRGLLDDYEIIVVDDGCTDRTVAIVQALAADNPRVRLVRQPRNLGYGAALRRGFDAATKQWVSFTDADCQFDLRELDRLLLLAKDYPLVCGYRIDRQDHWTRCFYSRVYNGLVRTLLGTGVRDIDCAMKIFHRDALQQLPITTDGFIVNAELLTRAGQQGMKVVEVGVTHRPRVAGSSKVSVKHIPPVLAALLRFWWTVVMFPPRDSSATDRQRTSDRLPPWSVGQRYAMTGLLGLIAGLLLFTNLNFALIEPDETRYAQIGLEMYDSGDWIVPTLNGEPYLDKPPLLYWLTAGSYALFGVQEWVARLPSAASAFLTVMVGFVLGRRLLGDRPAWIGAMMMMLCASFPVAGRFLILDGLLTVCTLVTILAVGLAGRAERAGWGWLAVAAIALALGVLTKGPVAVILCVPPIVAVGWLSDRREITNWRLWTMLFTPTLLTTIPWFVLMISRQEAFAGHFFWKHNLVRFFQAFDHQQPWWFYLPVSVVMLFPFSLLLPAIGTYVFGRGECYRKHRTPELGWLCFAAVWIVAFFSASSCKLPTYIMPAIPLFCLIGGKMFHDMVLSGTAVTWARQYVARIGKPLAIMFVGLGLFAAGADWVFGVRDIRGACLVVLVLVVVAILARSAARLAAAQSARQWVVLTSLSLLLGIYGFDGVLPQFAEWRGVAGEVAEVHRQTGPDVPIVYFGVHKQNGGFYLRGREVVDFRGAETVAFQDFTRQRPLAVIVAKSKDEEQLRQFLPEFSVRVAGGNGEIYVAERLSPQIAQHAPTPLSDSERR